MHFRTFCGMIRQTINTEFKLNTTDWINWHITLNFLWLDIPLQISSDYVIWFQFIRIKSIDSACLIIYEISNEFSIQ